MIISRYVLWKLRTTQATNLEVTIVNTGIGLWSNMDGYYEFDESGQGKQVAFTVTFTITISPGGGWRLRHGEKNVEQADERDLDPTGGV